MSPATLALARVCAEVLRDIATEDDHRSYLSLVSAVQGGRKAGDGRSPHETTPRRYYDWDHAHVRAWHEHCEATLTSADRLVRSLT